MTRTRTRQGLIKVLNAVEATGAGVALDVRNYKTIILQLAASGGASATVKFACSMQEDEPDFGSPASKTNRWSYVQMANMKNDSSVDGDTGLIIAADEVVVLEVNTNYIKWFCPIVTAYTSGVIDADLDAVNDLS